MSDTPQGPDWWQASDDKWYPPPRPEMPGQVTTAPLEQPAAGPPVGPPAGPPIGPPPGAPPGAPPSAGFPPGGPPSPYAGMPPGPQPPVQQNRTPLYIAIGVVVAAALVGLIVVLTSGDDDEPTAPPPTTQAPPASTGTEPPDTSDEPAPSGDGTVEVVDSGFSNFMAGADGEEKTGSYGFIVENTGDDIATDVQISVSAFAADGTALASVSHTVYVLRPGEKLGIGDEFYGENFPADIAEIQVDVGEPSDNGAEEVPDEGTLTAEGINTASDEYGLETTFTARSTYAEQVDSPMAYAIYRDASGKIIGGSYDYLDFIPPNGSVAASVQSYELIPNVASTEVYIDSGYWY